MSDSDGKRRYRLGWRLGGTSGYTDWQDWEPADADPDDIRDALGEGDVPEGLRDVLEDSGFVWWVEFEGMVE